MIIQMDLTNANPADIQNMLEKSCCDGKQTYECHTHFLTPGLKTHVQDCISKDKKGTSANILAELCKYNTCREFLFDETTLSTLIKNLSCDNLELLTQSCRALANLCYDMDSARTIIVEKGGLQDVISLIKTPKNSDIENNVQLKGAAVGLLLNVITDNEECHPKVISSEIPDKLLQLLRAELDSKKLTALSQHIILVMVTLAESEPMENIFTFPACKAAVEMLDICQEPTFFIPALAFLDISTVPDLVQYRLVEAGLFDLLVKRLEDQPNNPNEEDVAKFEMVGRVLCNLLTGDDAMKFVYNKNKTGLLKKLSDWLASDYILKFSSALCIGNIARTDAHSRDIVACGLHKEACKVLKGSNCDMKLQHAILSTLRNLAILKENKKKLVDDGVLDALMPLISLNIHNSAQVIFKLVGTLRQLVDGELAVALQLGKHEMLLDQLVNWSDAAKCPWVSSESLRLLCSLTTVSKDRTVATNLLKAKAYSEVTKLLTSQHQVMQMEAVNALTVGGALLKDTTCSWDTVLLESMVGEKIKLLFQTPDISVQLLENVITMLEVQIKYDKLKQHLKDADVFTALETTISSKEDFSKLKPKMTNLKNNL